MPRKKTQNDNGKVANKKGKKGGRSSQSQKSNKNNNGVDYIEVDEFTLDDLTNEDL